MRRSITFSTVWTTKKMEDNMNDLAEYLGFKKKKEKSLDNMLKTDSPNFSAKAVRTPSTTSVDKLN